MFALAVVIFLVVLVTGMYFIFSNKSEKKDSTPASETPSDSSSSSTPSSSTPSDTAAAPAFEVTLFTDSSFGGSSAKFTETSTPDLGGMNGKVSSLKVTGSSVKVTLYEQTNFTGNSATFNGPVEFKSMDPAKGFAGVNAAGEPAQFWDRARSMKVEYVSGFGAGACPSDSNLKPQKSVQLYYETNKYFALPLEPGTYELAGCGKKAISAIKRVKIGDDNYAAKIEYANGATTKSLKGDVSGFGPGKLVKGVAVAKVTVEAKSPFTVVKKHAKKQMKKFGNVFSILY
jgi:hypothetical protein